MSLICAISNEIPEAPVISPVSGSIFERRLIEKFILENGHKDPINGETLTADMLIDIKTPPFVKARPPTSTSIPGILKSLQDEWDSAMLNSFTLRQQLITARQELSHAMYQHDAACRVIARLSKEVTAAREALVTLKPQQGAIPPGFSQSSGSTAGLEMSASKAVGISPEVLQELQNTAGVLTQERKKRGKNVPEGLTSVEKIKDFQVISSYAGLHSAGSPGILCLDLHGNTIVTGGKDKVVTVFNKDTEQVVNTLKGHSNKVMVVACHPLENIVLSGSMDNSIKIWSTQNSNLLRTLRVHEGPITGLSLHATGDYLLSTSLDRFWAFSDIRTGGLLAKVCGDNDYELTSARFHPDGLIFATGTMNGQIKVWDLKEQTNVANFSGHVGPITGISFSENGYYLATAAEDSSVKLWDLRKLKNFKTIEMPEGYSITDLAFDQSGSYLAFIGNDIRVYGCKLWNEIAVFAEHTAMSTGVRFGDNASFIASTSMDRTLKIYSTLEK